MLRRLKVFRDDESGLVLVEYGLILTLITILVIGSLVSMGGSVSGFFTDALAGLAAR